MVFKLKDEDRPEPKASEPVPWRPRQFSDPQGTLIELCGLLRRLSGTLVQTSELLAESAALADPATHRRRAQEHVRWLAEDAGRALDAVDRLSRELRETGALSAGYSEGRG